ncbi:MAG: hypothetical protein Q7S33_00850 [Nanoarchaeota archaeon]|nr:hypothetical protein [Nanoarchaeota archaeon]
MGINLKKMIDLLFKAKKCEFLGTEFCTLGNEKHDICDKDGGRTYYSNGIKNRPAGCYRHAESKQRSYDILTDIKRQEQNALLSPWELGVNNDP